MSDAPGPRSLGDLIAKARKSCEMTQKELANRLRKEDGSPISPQYLNDIELGRRTPSSDLLLNQFADALGLDRDQVYFFAGQLPPDWRNQPYRPEAFQAFRRELEDE